MTEEEKEQLIIDRANAKVRCKESWYYLQQLRKMKKAFEQDWIRWKNRYELADRLLANEEKLIKVKTNIRDQKEKKELVMKLTKRQILDIAEILGVEVSINKENNNEDN